MLNIIHTEIRKTVGHQLQGFLGFANVYHRFIHSYTAFAPLLALTSSDGPPSSPHPPGAGPQLAVYGRGGRIRHGGCSYCSRPESTISIHLPSSPARRVQRGTTILETWNDSASRWPSRSGGVGLRGPMNLSQSGLIIRTWNTSRPPRG